MLLWDFIKIHDNFKYRFILSKTISAFHLKLYLTVRRKYSKYFWNIWRNMIIRVKFSSSTEDRRLYQRWTLRQSSKLQLQLSRKFAVETLKKHYGGHFNLTLCFYLYSPKPQSNAKFLEKIATDTVDTFQWLMNFWRDTRSWWYTVYIAPLCILIISYSITGPFFYFLHFHFLMFSFEKKRATLISPRYHWIKIELYFWQFTHKYFLC